MELGWNSCGTPILHTFSLSKIEIYIEGVLRVLCSKNKQTSQEIANGGNLKFKMVAYANVSKDGTLGTPNECSSVFHCIASCCVAFCEFYTSSYRVPLGYLFMELNIKGGING